MPLHLFSITCTSFLPPRDTPITFGKHKGKPLGTLPSKYLKWVSKTLRTRDTLHWAEMADRVLKDPVYKDRIEWEHAQDILTGNTNNVKDIKNAADELHAVSEMFGWDNDDKEGWKCVDFGLLGTSHGGKIPRKKKKEEEDGEIGNFIERRESGGRVRRRERVKVRRRERGDEEERNAVGHAELGCSEFSNRFPGREGLLRKVVYHRRGRSL